MKYSEIKTLYSDHCYKFFTDPYALNLFGIRSKETKVDEFNDLLGVAFVDERGGEICLLHSGTTKPGLHWLKNKIGNVNGTAILQPAQYLNCWSFGLHNGKYEALRQKGQPFSVWRDNDSDGELDYSGKTYTDVTGLNMHTTSFVNEIDRVGAYSAGCQVRQHDEDHEVIMAIVKKAMKYWGSNIFSYTLFEEYNKTLLS